MVEVVISPARSTCRNRARVACDCEPNSRAPPPAVKVWGVGGITRGCGTRSGHTREEERHVRGEAASSIRTCVSERAAQGALHHRCGHHGTAMVIIESGAAHLAPRSTYSAWCCGCKSARRSPTAHASPARCHAARTAASGKSGARAHE